MKKEIVINASKDRSRIAIVEGGQLSELYIENPDNVRTIGNIYLARIRKLMPAIRAAFVDIGQKQDAFLHFSDLTENLAGLLAIAGEAAPGVQPTLATAPAKRVGDDENEPPVSEKLDLGEEEAVSRTRGRRPSRPRGGPRRQHEEEEEQEEAGEGALVPAGGEPARGDSAPGAGVRRLPHVIDLTRRPGRVDPPRPQPAAPPPPAVVTAPAEPPPSEPAAPVESAVEAEKAAAPKRSRSRKKAVPEADVVAAPDSDASADAITTAAETAAEAPAEEAIKPARKSRSRKPAADTQGDETEATPRPTTRRKRPAKTASDAVADVDPTDAPPQDAVAPFDADAQSHTGRADVDSDAGVDVEGPDDDTASDGDSSRRRRRGRRGGRRRRRGGALTNGEGADSTEVDDRADVGELDIQAGDGIPDQPADAPKPPSRRAPRPTRVDEQPAAAEAPAEAPKPRPARTVTTTSRPEELLKRDGRILVKVSKEPISAKGSRVSTDISLAGRFLVLVPAADYVAVSKKIDSARERRRLRSLADSLRPQGFGIIVRTVAEGRDARAIDTDLRLLVDKWRKIEHQLGSRPEPPVTLYEDVSMVSSIVRDLFTDDYDRILVDDPKVHRNLKAYVQAVAPHMVDRVVLHRSNVPVFRAAGIERQVEEAFSSRVSLPTGGYLVIEHTEAMHVIDVNSGRAGRGLSQSENLLRVNMEAAKEVARQLRLRDLGGIIVVDFIDMYAEADRKKVYAALKDEFRKDRAVTKLLPMSDFGIIEITRQRLRPSLTQKADRLTDDAPAGDGGSTSQVTARMAAIGAGEIAQPERRYEPERRETVVSPPDLAATIDEWLRTYRSTVPDKYRTRPVTLLVHPLLGAFLRKGLPSRAFKWRFAMRGMPFRIEEDAGLDPLAFVVRDDKSGKSITSKYAKGSNDR